MPPLLTIIIPTIGRESLAEAIDSVNRQTIPTAIAVEWDPHRTGIGPTMNRALARVTTPWVGNLDDDDWLDPHYSEWLTKTLQRHPNLDMVIFRMRRVVNGTPKTLPPPHITTPDQLEYGNVGTSYAMRTELARRYPYVRENRSIGYFPDWEMIHTLRDNGHQILIVTHVAYNVRP